MKPLQRVLVAAVSMLCLGTGIQVSATTSDAEALHLLNRLGYGPRPGDVEMVKQIGAERYIDRQLHPHDIALPTPLQVRLAASKTANATAGEVLIEYHSAVKQSKRGTDADKTMRREVIGNIMQETAQARLWRALESPRQLEEVLVEFWFNHFNVFQNKGLDRALIASYERDAIRPHVLGRFRDLLGATAKHPAMLFYLDNWLSRAATPPASATSANISKGRANGLNENYARELMELHTLGVDGGYTQADVTELARILTGWTFKPRLLATQGETFIFDAQRHDLGDKQWLGRTITAAGQYEGELALDVLAMHPATARHLSYKLAQYFVNDDVPPELVNRLAGHYLASDGDIRVVLRALFQSEAFRSPEQFASKYKTPYHFVLSAVRAAGVGVENVRPLLGALAQLGMPLYGSLTPDGYKNTEEAWLNPDAITRRITLATALARGALPISGEAQTGMAMSRQMADQPTGNRTKKRAAMQPIRIEVLNDSIGGMMSPVTRMIIGQNPPALRPALMLGSPDFMQR